MSKNNQLRNATPERRNYKLYKAKKQWITACATFLLTFGATAAMNISAQADAADNAEQPEIAEVETSGSTTNEDSTAVVSAATSTETADQSKATSSSSAVVSQAATTPVATTTSAESASAASAQTQVTSATSTSTGQTTTSTSAETVTAGTTNAGQAASSQAAGSSVPATQPSVETGDKVTVKGATTPQTANPSSNVADETTLDTKSAAKATQEWSVQSLDESEGSTEDIAPEPYNADDDSSFIVAGSTIDPNDAYLFLKNGQALLEAGAKIEFVGTPDTGTKDSAGNTSSATIKITYKDGATTEVTSSFYLDSQMGLSQLDQSYQGYDYYYVKHVGDKVDSFDTPDENGNVLFSLDDPEHSLLNMDNSAANGGEDDSTIANDLKFKLIGNIDTSTAGIHFAKFQVTSRLHNSAMDGLDYNLPILGTYTIEVPYIVQGLKIRDDIPKDENGDPVINAQLSYQDVNNLSLKSGFDPTKDVGTLGQYFYQDYALAYALGVKSHVTDWTAPTDLVNTKTNHFTLNLNGLGQAGQNIDVKYATNPQIDKIYLFNQSSDPTENLATAAHDNEQFVKNYFNNANHSDAGSVEIWGTDGKLHTIRSTSVTTPSIYQSPLQGEVMTLSTGRGDLSLNINFDGLNSAGQPLIFGNGSFAPVSGTIGNGTATFKNDLNDEVNKLFQNGQTPSVNDITPVTFYRIATKANVLYPAEKVDDKVFDVSDGTPEEQGALAQLVRAVTEVERPGAVVLPKDADGNTIWPANTTFSWQGTDGSTNLILNKAGMTKKGDVTITLGSTGTSCIVKDITVRTKAEVNANNETFDYGTKKSAADLVTNKDMFPEGTTFQFVDNSEPDWTKPGSYNKVHITATYPLTDENGHTIIDSSTNQPKTVTTPVKEIAIAINDSRIINVFKGSTAPSIDDILALPTDWETHTATWTHDINTNAINQGEITIHYPSSGLDQEIKVYVNVISKLTTNDNLSFKTDGESYDGSTGKLLKDDGDLDSSVLISNPSDTNYESYQSSGTPGTPSTISTTSQTQSYTVSGLQKNADGTLVSGPQIITYHISVPKGTIGAQTDVDGNSYYEITSRITVAQPVTFEFVDDDSSNSAVVGTPQTQEFIKGTTTDLDSDVKANLTVPTNYELATGQTIPPSYTLADYSATNPVVKIHLVHKKTVTVENQTKSATVHYINGATGQAMGSQAPDASWTAYYTRNKTVDAVTNQTTYSDWQLDTSKGTNGISETGSWTVDAATGKVTISVPTIKGSNAYDANNTKITSVTLTPTDKGATATVTYGQLQSVNLKFVDDDNHEAQVGSTVTEQGFVGHTATLTVALPTNYQLADNQTDISLNDAGKVAVSYKFTSAENQAVTIHLKHKTEDVSATDPQAQETRTLTVEYINVETGKPMGDLAPDAKLDVYYKRTAIKDLVTGDITYGNWQWDQSRGDAGKMGYHVVSGSWSIPDTNWFVFANIPNVNGYKWANGDGIWAKNKDGSVFTGPTNRFCSPTWSEIRDGKRQEAYEPNNSVYDTTPTHIVYYVPTGESKDLTVLQGSTLPDKDSILDMPTDAPAHTTSWSKNINADATNQGEITIHYTDSGLDQTVAVNVKVIPKMTAKNGIEFTTDGNLYDGTTGSIKNGDNEGQLLINTPSESLGYTPTYSVSGLHYDSNGKLVSGNQTATIRISVPKGTIGAQTDSAGNSYYEVTSNIVVAQPVTFEFVNQYDQVVGSTYSQEFIAGKAADLKTTLQTPQNCTLASGESIPTSYTLPAFTTDKAIVKIKVNETLNFNIVYWDDTDNKQLAAFNIKNPASGGYSPLTADLTAKGVTYDKYQFVKITGVPSGVTVSGNYWSDDAWAIPNYKWPDLTDETVMGATFTFHLKHIVVTVNGSDLSSIPSGTDQNDFRQTITRTINQVLPNGTSQLQKQDAVITRTRKYDKATEKFIGDYGSWTNASWSSYTPSTPDGYELDKIEQVVDGQTTEISSIEAANVTVDTKPTTINVIYKARPKVNSFTLKLVDDDDHEKVLSQTTLDNPVSGGWTNVSFDNSDNYHCVGVSGVPTGVTLAGDGWKDITKDGNWVHPNFKWEDTDSVIDSLNGATMLIHLKHNTQTVDGANPGAIPSGVDHDDLIKNVTRTINEYLPSGKVTQTQTATLTRTATYDEVTKKLVAGSESQWQSSSWAAFDIDQPGYTATIKQDGVTAPLTSIAEQTVDENTQPVVINVTYSATATAKLTGNGSATYTGKQITIDDLNNSSTGLKITVTGPTANAGTLALKAGDVEFSTDGTTWTTTLPTDAKTYQVRLTTQGEDAIKNKYGNNSIVWTDKDGKSTITSDATFTINPLSANSVLNNTSEGNYTKVYDGSATTSVDPSKLGITVQLNGQAVNLDMTGLTGADFQWVDTDGNAAANPQNVGTYYIKLTSNGLNVLQAHNKNFTLKNSGLGTYTITQASASGKLAGSNSRTYNGQATTTAEVNSNGQIVVTVSFPGVKDTNNKYTLHDGDYTWNTTDGNAPTNAGDYQITLNATGISNIENYILALAGKGQNNTANVKFADTDFTGSAQYTIKKAAATATIGGQFERTYNGQAASGTEVYGHITWTGHDTVNDADFTLVHPLNAGDYAWYTKNSNGQYVAFTGTQPVNAGTYYLILNPEYATKLDQANPNYEVTLARDAALTYTIDKAKATVTISGSQNSKYNGHPVTVGYGNFPVSITTNNGQTITAPSGAELTAADVVITDSQGRVVTDPTKIDTYTITLTPAGLQKFASQTDNYYWVSAGTGTLSITRNTDTSVKLEGNENVVYTGSTAKINPSNFHVTLGNGETYTLQDGDLQFVDQTTGANMDAGHSYQVELSDQGRRNIAQVDADNYGYDFTNVGNGTVTVTKATPSASLAGTAEKNYDGTPISGYVPTVTITAPGNNSVTLTSGDFEWTKDGHTYTTAPTDAGTYTVSLTPTGLAKVKAVNSQNLDWSNVQVTGTGTYKIDKANATITVPSERTETVTWNGDSATINPSQFTPTVTSDNPNASNIALPDTLRLTAGDYQFLQGGRVISAPSEVGTYQVQLTEAGWHKVRDAIAGNTNYNWTYQGEGTYHINKATATITLNGTGSTTYTGSSAVIPSVGGTVTGITVTLSNGQTYDLKPEDLEFVNAQGQKIDAPTDAGTYKVRLTSTAVGKISGLEGGHYDYTYDNGTVDFTINKATADVNLSQTQTSSYTGGAISPDAGKFAITITTNNGQTLTYDLRSGDVTTTVSAPTNVGSYDVVLTDAGKANIEGLNANYDYHFADGHGTLEITQARATATLSGQGTRPYNGVPVTVDDLNVHNAKNNITLTLHYPKDGNADYLTTVDLTANDFEWNTPDGNAPVDANSTPYRLSLKPSVIKALLEQAAGSGQGGKANVSVAASDITGSASYTITPLPSTATVSNIETGNYGKAYDAQVTDQIDPAKLHITTTVNGRTVELNTNGLTGDDFAWVDGNGTPLATADYPKNVGTYYIALTGNGLTKLQAANPNFTLTSAGQGTYKISQAQGTAKLVGSNSKTYNGSAITTAEVNSNGQIVVNLTFPGGGTNTSYTLQHGDYTITPNNPANTDSTNAGTYTITLTTAGKHNIAAKVEKLAGTGQDNQANVTVDDSAISGDATFTINASPNVVSVSGTQNATYTGQPISVDYDPSGTNSVTVGINSTTGAVADISGVRLAAGDFQIVNASGDPVTATNAGGVYHIILTAAGIAKIQTAVGKNYQVSQSTTSFGKLVINQASASATFSGHPTYTYTGRPNSNYLSGFTVTLSEPGNQTYNLQDGDIEFNVNGTWTKNVPTNKGTYDVRLSADGWTHIKNINKDNVSWPEDPTTGTGTYTINAATATTELSGHNSMVYNGNPVTTGDLYTTGSSIQVVINGDHITGLPTDFTLEDGDYTWGTTDHQAPKNAGHYTITLSGTGLDKIQDAIDQAVGAGNVVLSRDSTGTASFDIAKAVSENVQLSGSLRKQYDGQAASFDPTDAETKTHYFFDNVTGLTIPNLTATDFEWVDGDGNVIAAPTAAGYYYLRLNKDGRDAIANANPNYTFVDQHGQSTISGQITYHIYPATLEIGVSGTASKVYNGQDAKITQAQLDSGQIKLVWGNSSSEPADLGGFTLKPDELEVVDEHGNAVSHANAHGNETTGNPVYYVRLTNAALTRIKGLTGAANYDISLSNSTGSYLIYAHKAQVTLTGNQTTTYGTDLALDPTKYVIDLTNWTADAPVPTNAEILRAIGGLKPGDVYINGYATADKMPNGQMPTDVGSYQVMISSQLLTKLKNAFPDYDWDAVGESNGLARSGGSGSGTVEAEHDPARYVITPAVTTVTINGAQHVKYGEATTIEYGDSGYTITITAPVKNATVDNPAAPIYTNVELTDGDLEFVSAPRDVGSYEVKLSDQGIRKLNHLTGSTNYDWAQASTARAGFYVDQMPVTITVGGDTQTVTYGSPQWLTAITKDAQGNVYPHGYTLNVVTTDGTTLAYTAQAGDLVFTQTPAGVGSYEVKLSDQGLAHIKAALGTNYTYPQAASDVTTHGNFIVSQGEVTVALGGSDSKTYNGHATTPADLNTAGYHLTYSATVYAPDGTAQTITLTPSDLQFVGGNPVNVGHYGVELSPSGQAKLKDLTGNNGDNYNWTFMTTATYDINAATEASAKLAGANQKVFDGSAVTTAQLNNGGNILVHLTFPGSTDSSTYQLQDGDYTWAGGSAPTNVGTYTINLTRAGLAHLQRAIDALAGSDNVVLSDDHLTGSATFEIVAKPITNVTISGSAQSKTYDGQAADLDVSGLTISGDGALANTPLSDRGITPGDFDWYDEHGIKLNAVPTNAGHYEARLKASALATLQDANKNYRFSAVDGMVEYTINPAPATETLSNQGSKNYDGEGVATSDVLGTLTWTPGGEVAGHSIDLSSLTADDYEWYTENAAGVYTAMTGEPTAAGTYYLKLKTGAIDKIKSANPNYSFADGAISGEFTYTINKANARITLPGTSSQTITWTGNPATVDPRNFVPTITSDNPNAGMISLPSDLNLTADDYQFLQGGRVIAAPSAVGTYQVQLTADGWHKVRDAIAGNTNYNWDYTGEGNYHINKAAATITLNGSSSTVYSGRPAVIPSRGGTVTGITVTLSNGQTYDLKPTDLEFVNDRGEQVAAPTDVGNYKVRLTDAAVTAISGLDSDHYNYTYDHGTVDFAITQMPVTITVGDKATVPSVTYGRPITLDPSDYNITVKTADGETLSYTPVAGDLQFVGGTPTTTGTFQVALSNDGLQHIKDEFGTKNYTYSSTGHGSFTVTAATAGITINGSDSKLYDGEAATLTPGDYQLVITTNNGQTINIPINAGDLVFSAGSAPVNVGTYDVTLSQSALDTIKREYSKLRLG